jgi:hypothetical protein
MRRSIETGIPVTAVLLWLAVIITGVVGWVLNIVKLMGMTLDAVTIELVLRGVGIFVAPLGSIMGLFF